MKRSNRAHLLMIYAACIVGAPLPSYAHGSGEPPHAVSPLLNSQGMLVGVGASYGLLLHDEREGTWLWTSDEALDAVVSGWMYLDSGRVVAATTRGPLSSDDGGCTWDAPSEMPGAANVLSIAKHEVKRELFAAVESTRGGGLWRSSDEGASWTWTALRGSEILAQRVMINEDLILVSGLDRRDRLQHIWRSVDAGKSWEEVASGMRCAVLGLATERHALLVACDEQGVRWKLGRVTMQGDPRWLVTHDDERWPEQAAQKSDGTLLWQDQMQRLHVTPPLTTMDEDARTLCVVRDVRGTLWRCLETTHGADAHLLRLDEEQSSSWEAVAPWRDVVPRVCPRGSAGAVQGALYWPVHQMLGVGAAPPPLPEEEEGCQCAATGARQGPGGICFLCVCCVICGVLARIRAKIHRV